MKKPFITMMAVISMILAASCTSAENDVISIETMLDEMVSRDNIAHFPKDNFRLQQQSSYNRASKSPDDYEGWFMNHDFNSNKDDHNFIRVEERNGEKEWVMMEHLKPGVMVRTWAPFKNPKTSDTDLIIRVYIDGETDPTLEGNMLTLFNGEGLIPYPLAHKSLRSAVSFMPIPYAKSCKVTLSGVPQFFQFTYREYCDEVEVESFTMERFEAAKPKIEETCRLLSEVRDAAPHKSNKRRSTAKTIKPNEEQKMELPKGVNAVDYLALKLGSFADTTITSKVILKISFDGKETVKTPIGAFFGSGRGLNPFQDWYRRVDKDGTMSSRWVMPYQKSATVSILNTGDEDVEYTLDVDTKKWKWDDRTLYFHAGYREQNEVPTRPFSDWNYVEIKGRGVYVGDALTVFNPVYRWWGEGDEKIWIDDNKDFPALFGTGTEDYYGYSWGGISSDFYEHAFHAQTQCYRYNSLNRKSDESEACTKLYSTETRTRALDGMPFESYLKLDMEVWHWFDVVMKYSVGTYWYADYDSTSNVH